jgi:sugar lactone lactonase YvrE
VFQDGCSLGSAAARATKVRNDVIVRVPSGLSAIDWLPDGRMLIAPWSGRHVLRSEPDGSLMTHAELTSLSEYAWNDMAVDGRGNAYLGNLGWDFPKGEFRPGIVALVTSDGTARQVADDLYFPNGMVVTPDNSTLIIAELGVGQSVETRQGAVVERSGEVGELGALGRSEQLAGRHGGLA